MPKETSATGEGTPVSGDHSNATELASPVEDKSLDLPVGDPDKLGSRTEDAGADVEEVEAVVPARLKGKNLAQTYQEFSGLEKEYSRQGNELGEARNLLRQVLEQSLKQSGAKATTEEEPELTDDEILADPKTAVNKIVDRKLKPIREAAITAEQRASQVEFEGRHPGYRQEAVSPEFQDWVKTSPYRVRLFKAAAGFDLQAAEDLFTAWDEVKTAKVAAGGEEQEDPAKKKREAIKRTTTETGGAGKSVDGKSGKKIYKSSELMRLYVQDRERYNEMSDEIRLAFTEGRVR